MFKFVLCFVLLIAAVYCETCTTDGECQDCTNNVKVCNDLQGVECGNVTGSFPSDSPCSGVSDTDKICGGATLTVYTKAYVDGVLDAFNTAFENCKKSNITDTSCCTNACTSSSCVCPSNKCTSTENKDVKYKKLASGAKYCYKDCTDCSSGGFTTAYCNDNCGDKGTKTWACDGDDKCCSVGSGSILSSWLF